MEIELDPHITRLSARSALYTKSKLPPLKSWGERSEGSGGKCETDLATLEMTHIRGSLEPKLKLEGTSNNLSFPRRRESRIFKQTINQ